jgi:hypothetical protein
MSAGSSNPDKVLKRAVRKVVEADDHLRGSTPERWLLVLETDAGERKTLSVFESPGLKPWESLGLLRFATLQEEMRAVGGPPEEGDDEA